MIKSVPQFPLTMTQAAEWLGVSLAAVTRWRKLGALVFERRGRTPICHPQDLLVFAESAGLPRDPNLLTTQETGKILGISSRAVWQTARRKGLKGYPFGIGRRKRMYLRADVEALRAAKTTGYSFTETVKILGIAQASLSHYLRVGYIRRTGPNGRFTDIDMVLAKKFLAVDSDKYTNLPQLAQRYSIPRSTVHLWLRQAGVKRIRMLRLNNEIIFRKDEAELALESVSADKRRAAKLRYRGEAPLPEQSAKWRNPTKWRSIS